MTTWEKIPPFGYMHRLTGKRSLISGLLGLDYGMPHST